MNQPALTRALRLLYIIVGLWFVAFMLQAVAVWSSERIQAALLAATR